MSQPPKVYKVNANSHLVEFWCRCGARHRLQKPASSDVLACGEGDMKRPSPVAYLTCERCGQQIEIHWSR